MHSHVVCYLRASFSRISRPHLLVNSPGMDWTGGHLKRQCKANANHKLKSQKQHFARARQRLQNGSVLAAPSNFSIFDGQINADQHDDSDHTQPRPKQFLKSSKEVPRRDPSRDGPDTPADASASCNDDASAPRLTKRHEKNLPKVPNAPGAPKSLDQIKLRLLQKSDWTGLALARPVSIMFTPAEEMERIGRRRKVTKEERRRKIEPRAQQMVHHNLIRPFDHRHSQSTAPVPEATDLSIRIGSNIHHTLTTQTSLQEQPQSSSYHSTDGESMLLDKFEHSSGDTRDYRAEALYLGADEESVHASRGAKLVPLDAARDLKSFDEVRRRSSSMVRQVPPSSTPLGSQLPSQRTPVRPSRRWTSPASLYESSVHPKDVVPTLDQSEHSSLAVRNSRKGREEQSRLGSMQRSDLGSTAPRPGTSKFEKTTTSDYGDQPSASMLQGQASNITLDHLIALEQGSSGQDCSSLQEEGPVDSPLENHQKLQHSPNSSSQIIANGTPLPTTPSLACAGEAGRRFASLPASSLVSLGSPGSQSPVQRPRQPSESRLQAPMGPMHTSPPSKRSPPEVQEGPQGVQSWMEKFQLAKAQSQASMWNDSMYTEKPGSWTGHIGDENEAWMRFVFPEDFGRIQTDFTFGTRALGKFNRPETTVSSWHYNTQSLSTSDEGVAEHLSAPRAEASAHLSGISAPSGANATIFDAGWSLNVAETGALARSETDFLSRFSPMGGLLDEGLGDMSIYNNAAASDRSFVSMPLINTGPDAVAERHSRFPAERMVPAKRDAIYAFDEPTEPNSPDRRQRRRLRAAALPPPRQRGLIPSEALARSQITPWQVRGQNILQSEFDGSQSSGTGLSRYRGAAFPMSYSPASSNTKTAFPQPTLTAPTFRPSATSSSSIVNDFDQNLSSPADRHSLWQDSPSRSGTTGSNTAGSRLRGAAPGTPLFGNDGRKLETMKFSDVLRYS